jgi:DNA-binding transcriptional LysR family regulator
MAPIDLNLLRAFAAVYDAGTFSGAAQSLGVPRSTISRSVAALEDAVGAQLFHRTTRKVSTTLEGRALYDRTAPALTSLKTALTDLPRPHEEPTGVLKMTAPADLGRVLLAEAAARFAARFPKVTLELHLSNRVVDLVREGFDLALRISSRPLRDSNSIARKVGSIAMHLYAAPSYLARRGTPRTPEELVNHDVISLHDSGPQSLTSAEHRTTVRVAGRIQVDDMLFIREVVRAGAGIATLPSFLAAAELAEGSLVRVLPKWATDSGTAFLVQPQAKNIPTRVSAFKELLLELLRQRPLE